MEDSVLCLDGELGIERSEERKEKREWSSRKPSLI